MAAMLGAHPLSKRVILTCIAGLFPLLTACGGDDSAQATGDGGGDAIAQEGGGDDGGGDATSTTDGSTGDAAPDVTVTMDAGHDATGVDAPADTTSGDGPTDATGGDAAFDAGAVSWVLGEPDPQTDLPVETGFFYAQSMFIVGTKLIVSDNGGRVLVWNTLPTAAGTLPDLEVGEPDLGTTGSNANLHGPTGATLFAPQGVWSDGTHLFVVDAGNNRVLVWNTFPTQSGQAADFALGQPGGAGNLTSNTANNGGVSGASLSSPADVWSDGTQLYVADYGNNRVLVWSTLPTSATAATYVLGQSSLTSATSGSGLGQMNEPTSVHSVGTTLYVGDGNNDRILAWSAIPTSTTDASFAIASAGNVAQMTHTGSTFFASDDKNNRLLVWNTNPTAANQAPDLVFGPQDINTCQPTSTTICMPFGVATDGTRLYVGDYIDRRVLAWNTIPTSTSTPADFAIGQPAATDLTTSARDKGTVTGATFGTPWTTTSDGTRLFVADDGNNRVLVWNAVPTSSGAPADFALGQPAGAGNLTSFQPNAGGVSGSTLDEPMHATSDGTRLFVADSSNNRVLVWNTMPTAPVAADFALGQPVAGNLTSNADDNGGLGGGSMSFPAAVWTDGTRLFVVDENNSRVLVWNTMPTSPVAADFALGQPAGAGNLTSGGNGNAADQMQYPSSVESDGTRLIVTDSGNDRVLIWNSIPTAPVAADVVVGKPAFGMMPTGNASQSTLNGPNWAHSDGTKLWIADTSNNRVVVWNPIPTTNGAPAWGVIGQPDFTSNAINGGGALSASGLQVPTHVTTIGGHVYVTDAYNNRTLVF